MHVGNGDRIIELQNDFSMHDDTKMLLFISIATNDMVKYVFMYPDVWFLDCTYGEILYINCRIISQFESY